MAAQNEYLQEASETIFTLSSDELVRKRCLDREAYYIDIKAMQEDVKALQEKVAEEKEKNVKLQDEVASKNATIAQQAAELEYVRKQLAQFQANSK